MNPTDTHTKDQMSNDYAGSNDTQVQVSSLDAFTSWLVDVALRVCFVEDLA